MQCADAAENHFGATSASGNIYELRIESEVVEVLTPLPVTITVSNQAGAPIQGQKSPVL
jgi:hypothetical protein